jgi:hypothetical protein
LKRSGFAVALRDFYSSIRLGLVFVVFEIVSDLRKKRFEPSALDVVKTLTVDTGGTIVSLGYAVRLPEDFDFRDMYEDSPETMSFIRLRLSIYPSSQFLHSNGRLYHLTHASPQ